MGVFYFLWSFGAPLLYFLEIWRHHSERYVPLGFELDDECMVGARKVNNPAFRLTVHRRPSWVRWLFTLFVTLYGVYLFSTYELPIDHRFKPAVTLANRVPKRGGCGTGGAILNFGWLGATPTKSHAEKIFIAAMFHNNAYVLPYWITEISKLVNYLGPVRYLSPVARP
jgi:hypothetical protein